MDQTYIKVKGEWTYLYCAVDKYGKTIDFLLTEQRDEPAAKKFLIKAIRRHSGVPEKITIDGSAASEAAIQSYNQEHSTSIAIRKVKYLNHIVEIVFTQLTKTRCLTVESCRDGIADFHITIGDQNPIDQEFNQGSLLLECGLS